MVYLLHSLQDLKSYLFPLHSLPINYSVPLPRMSLLVNMDLLSCLSYFLQYHYFARMPNLITLFTTTLLYHPKISIPLSFLS